MTEKMSRRRVKFYSLNKEHTWDDRGTGHVTSTSPDSLKDVYLIVKSEADGSILLESQILPATVYQKQQGSLIVWTEGENVELALSFQEHSGCNEIWEQICEVQGVDPNFPRTREEERDDERYEARYDGRYEEQQDANLVVDLPPCELGKLEEIRDLIGSCLASAASQDKLAILLENENYIRKLVAVFRICEDIENTEGLHLLYEIFKQIFHLNKHSLLDIMFSEELIFDVVGALEYDPSAGEPRRHRQYLKSTAKFKQVIPLDNAALVKKIHQTYRVQYVQDVVLPMPQVFEENMLSTLSSFIFFNKVDIVNMIQEDKRILQTLFLQLSSPEDDVPLARRRDLMLFLKEYCTYSQTLEPGPREIFFKKLVGMDCLAAMEFTISMDDPIIKAASIDIISYIVEYSPGSVREYMIDQHRKVDEEQYLFNTIVEQIVLDVDPEMGGAVQLMGTIRTLIDTESVNSPSKYQQSEFLNLVYRYSMHTIVAPLLSNTVNDEVVKDDYPTAHLLSLILELLTFCVQIHTYHIKNYLMQRELIQRILVLMKSKHTFLVLAALRFFRKIIGLKDDVYNRHIVNFDLFEPVVNAFVKNNGRYNLLDSAILEMFECISKMKIFILCDNIVERYGGILSKIDYVQTFRSLAVCYSRQNDDSQELHKNSSSDESMSIVRGVSQERFRKDARDLDPEEKNYFNAEDDDLEPGDTSSLLDRSAIEKLQLKAVQSPPKDLHLETKTASVGLFGELVRKVKGDSVDDKPLSPVKNTASGGTSPPTSPSATVTAPVLKKLSLVDYDENSDDEEAPEENTTADGYESPCKRPRVSSE